MKRLLIYIPSYNRYDLLVQQLAVLSQAIDAGNITNVSIIVSDNASPDVRYLTIKQSFPQQYLSVSRNNVNIGIVGNLIHGFEQKDWDYIWLLSDDDVIAPTALSAIAHEVGAGIHDFFYLKCNIKGDESVQADEVIVTQREYFRKFSSISMIGLISANIYPSKIRQHIEYMYLYGYTLFPYIAGVIRVMNAEQFSLKCIGGNLLEWKQNRRSYGHIYEMALTNVLIFLELIDDKMNQELFVSKHISDFGISHFFPYAIKNLYNFKKAWAQVGFSRLLFVAASYAAWQGRLHMLGLIKLIFPTMHARLRQFWAGKL